MSHIKTKEIENNGEFDESQILDTIKGNSELKEWISDHFKMGFSYQVKKFLWKWIRWLYNLIYGPSGQTMTWVENMAKLGLAAMHIWKDVFLYMTFQHFCHYVLVSTFENLTKDLIILLIRPLMSF